MSSILDTTPNLDVDYIAALNIQIEGATLEIAKGETRHRVALISHWDIKPGSTILELGCGQGDCTVALAVAVGPNGHVTAIDPGPPDYGSYIFSQFKSISDLPIL